MRSTKKVAETLLITVLAWTLVTLPTRALWAQDVPQAPEAPEEAAETPQERLLPEWTRQGDYACFTFEQTQVLLVLEQNALRWRTEAAERLELNIDLQALRLNLETQVTELQSALELRETRILELTTQVNEEIAEKNRWRAEAETPDVWPLLVGGILALLGVGLGVGVLVAGLTD